MPLGVALKGIRVAVSAQHQGAARAKYLRWEDGHLSFQLLVYSIFHLGVNLLFFSKKS